MSDRGPVAKRLEPIIKAQERIKPLLNAGNQWANECEGVFSDFRRSVIHLRKDQEALDAVEEKDVAWRFLCKFSKDRPPFHGRCEEVLKILMASDSWMREFGKDPECDPDTMPPGVKDEFKRRLDEVDPDAKSRSWKAPAQMAMSIVVQRCVSGRVSISGKWQDFGPGLVINLSFTQIATPERVEMAAKSLLLAKVSGSSGAKPESVVSLSKQSKSQTILVVPTVTLVSQLGDDDGGVTYQNLCEEAQWAQLYRRFIQQLEVTAAELVTEGNPPSILTTPVGDTPSYQMTSDGFVHSFIY